MYWKSKRLFLTVRVDMLAVLLGEKNSIKLKLSMLIAAAIIAIGALLCVVYLSREWSGWQSAGLVVIAGLLGVFAAGRISERFTKPVMELVRGASELSAGNLDYRVKLTDPREIGLLAAGFNDMAASLKEKIEGLENSRAEAEELTERLSQSFREATRTAGKLREANEWMTEMALRMEEANKQLKVEKVQTETIVHSMTDGLVALDKDERIMLVNPEAEYIFDVRDEQVRGKHVQVLVDSLIKKVEEPESFLRKFMATTSNPESESMFNITISRPYRKVLRRRSSAIRDEAGDIIGRIVSFSDITREREVDEMKSNFVSIVSHELRTPLTSIKGALALLQDGQMDEPEARAEFLSIAEQNTDRLISLISNLLDLSKMESGMLTLNLSRMDMRELIDRQVRSLDMVARQRGILIEPRFVHDEQSVFVDREKLEQVVTNLLGNALKFSPDGGRILIKTEVAEDEFRIVVEDEGVGVPGDKLEKIFGKFYQVDMSATRTMGGTGLGLTICKAIVKEHGGRIWAESPVTHDGRGTRVVVSLPKAGILPRNTAGLARKSEAAASFTSPGSVRDTVLIAGGDAEALRAQSEEFEREGFRVFTATTGKDALRIAREDRPGFIFIDVTLPDLSGYDVASILRKDPVTKDVPIVFASGDCDKDAGRMRDLGTGCMMKPVAGHELVAAVRQYYS